jgi:small subunit ribosomal protein S3
MSVVKHFVSESLKRTEIDEFLRNEFEKAGYGGVDLAKTPLGTHIVVYAMRPGLVIGRGGETIKELAMVMEQKFGLPNPQISVAEIEIPELNPYVIASRVTSALKRGVHFRRAGFWALQQVMESGAAGAEIVIRGKLRTERARFEKFRDGYLPKSGDPAHKNLREAVLNVQLKPGLYGIKVRILPANSPFPDQVKITEPAAKEEPQQPETVEAPKEAEEQLKEEETEKPEEAKKPEETKKPRKRPAAPRETAPPETPSETPTEPEAVEEKTAEGKTEEAQQ